MLTRSASLTSLPDARAQEHVLLRVAMPLAHEDQRMAVKDLRETGDRVARRRGGRERQREQRSGNDHGGTPRSTMRSWPLFQRASHAGRHSLPAKRSDVSTMPAISAMPPNVMPRMHSTIAPANGRAKTIAALDMSRPGAMPLATSR